MKLSYTTKLLSFNIARLPICKKICNSNVILGPCVPQGSVVGLLLLLLYTSNITLLQHQAELRFNYLLVILFFQGKITTARILESFDQNLIKTEG